MIRIKLSLQSHSVSLLCSQVVQSTIPTRGGGGYFPKHMMAIAKVMHGLQMACSIKKELGLFGVLQLGK